MKISRMANFTYIENVEMDQRIFTEMPKSSILPFFSYHQVVNMGAGADPEKKLTVDNLKF